SVVFSPDSSEVLAVDASTANAWKADTGRIVRSFNAPMGYVAFSPDHQHLLSATSGISGSVQIRSAATGSITRKLNGKVDEIVDVSYSPDGQRIMIAAGGELKYWDTATGRLIFTIRGAVDVRSFALSPDGKFVATGYKNGTAEVWDLGSRQVSRSLAIK